ncbi:alpha-1,2-fucosyltransferase [Microbacterium terrisoli]|uniref:alpha-1,2-fucosyltransferase n=1 Tax=Microbacterium terrisoli TaxID=3242192 RepID=UPI002804194B|nr:alpha-1,2-fucosyltransferase [Microbacterium protaetiae]
MTDSAPRAFAAQAWRHLRWRARRSITVTADRMRRGDRTIIMTPPAGLRFGNWLYLWLDAHQKSTAGRPTMVLEAPGMAPWFDLLPALRTWTLPQDGLRFHDRRDWNDRDWRQNFGSDFTRETLRAFIVDCVAHRITRGPQDRLVLNVRRGDYYARPEFRRLYAFDQFAYVEAALARFNDVGQILVVSDDAEWCREHLDGLLRSSADDVSYASPDPVANFVAVAGARRIIGMNSTFTYWAAYVSDAMNADAEIVMPKFHSRLYADTDAHQLDPRWTALPGFH